MKVAQHLSFYDKRGDRRIRAEVTKLESIEESKELQRFEEEKPVFPLEQFVKVTPATPLPVDSEWLLVTKKGLVSKDKKFELAKDQRDYLGLLTAFKVKSITPQTPYDEKRFISIRTTKYELIDSLTPELLTDYISVDPIPDGFALKRVGYGVQIGGNFGYRKYVVKVKPGLIAKDRTSLTEEVEEEITFQPNPGFISLPTERVAQNASGKRAFQIMTGNLHGVNVRIKNLERNELIYALRGYDAAYKGYGDEKRAIPYEMVPGKTIFNETYKRAAANDHSEKIDLTWDRVSGGKKYGAFYLCAEGSSATRKGFSVGGQSLVQLTDIGLAWKQAGDETLFYSFSVSTGEPVGEVTVELLDDDAESLRTVTTDATGVGRMETGTLEEKKGVKWWLDARKGEDRHVMSFRKSMRSMGLYGFDIQYRHWGRPEARRTLVFTDRPVYKPGDTVYFKVISRGTDTDGVLPPEKTPAKLKIFDVRNKLITERDVELSENGTFDDSFTLPKSGLGSAQIHLDFNRTTKSNYRLIARKNVRVADYRPNTFEVDLATESSYPLGEAIEVPLRAKYYMGKPLSKAKVNWQATARREYRGPKGFKNFTFYDDDHSAPNFSESREIHLSEKGDATIRLELPEQTASPAPMRVNLTTEIVDVNQQTIAERSEFLAHSSDFYLGMKVPEGNFRVGQKMPISFVAVSKDGKLHTDSVQATLKLGKRTYNTVKVRGAGGRMQTRNEVQITPKSESEFAIETRPAIDESEVATATIHEIDLDEPGDFYISVSAKDSEGRDVLTRRQIRVIGADEPSWAWRQMQRVDLLPDKSSYKVGQTARLLLRTPVFGHALITIERAGVRRTFTKKITGYETIIDVPIKDGDAPNLFTSVFLVRGSDDSPHKHPEASYRLGYCQLNVDDPDTILDVAVQPKSDAEFYQPGEPIEVAALVTDNEGNGVPGSEVTLYAVDEGVLSLTGYKTPEPASTFNRPFPLLVKTGQSLSNLMPENPAEFDFHNKGYVVGGGGAMAGPDPARVRRDFKALAFWEGALVTGKDGKVTAKFDAPDNLTTFRIMAVAVKGNRF
ncbi:MAG: hypothetical protein HKN23_00540, partial [Verrucomicrobiales bacterium]|nr:hypothetical protein [Verrucomicrobiales bacterium]